MTLEKELKRKALELGFVKAGITDAAPFQEYYDESHIRKYYSFLEKDKRHILQNARALDETFPEAKSILSVIYSYGGTRYPGKLTQYVARAYQGRGYGPAPGSVNAERIRLLKDYIRSKGIHIFEDCFIPDRAAAARAGCVMFGRNNFAYCGDYGSFIIITNFVLDVPLSPDEPTMYRECPANCRLCMEACPTGAIESEARLCPQKCIGFNNWFRQDEKGVDPFIPEEIRPKLGTHFHGCDICQEVCPRNRKILSSASFTDPFLEYLSERFDLEKILFLDEKYYEDVIRPVMYNYIGNFRYFRRNAAIVMGNSGDHRYIASLGKAAEDGDELVADAAKWALSRLRNL